MGKIKNLIGKKFDSGIEVLEFSEIKNHAAYWKCKCHCGNIFIARGADLTNGHTKSCGCTRNKSIQKIGLSNKEKYIKDLTNQRFGKLIVLEPTSKRDRNRGVIWKCLCDCGNIVELPRSVLLQGQSSCGCAKSKGELKIAQLLIKAGIPFETQKTFDTCIFPDTKRLARFDFYVNNSYLIEYDGIQHFDDHYGWNTTENFKKIQFRDNYKNDWCKENGIPLIRIPYTNYEKLAIQDLILK